MKWGPPARVASDGSNGEILIYAAMDGGYGGTTYWRYRMFYVNNTGTVYHWLVQEAYVPPQQLNVNMYVH